MKSDTNDGVQSRLRSKRVHASMDLLPYGNHVRQRHVLEVRGEKVKGER